MMSIDGSNCAMSPLGRQSFASVEFEVDPRKVKLNITSECAGYHTHGLNCSGRDWKSRYHDLVALFVKISQDHSEFFQDWFDWIVKEGAMEKP
jgi:hypothetical protein